MPDVKLSRLRFKAGAAPGSAPLEVDVGEVVLIVGPNNSGKSLALREIEKFSSENGIDGVVLSDVTFTHPQSADDVISLLKKFETIPPTGNNLSPGHIWVAQHSFGKAERNFQFNPQSLRNEMATGNIRLLRTWFFPFFTVRLDGRTRFSLTDPMDSGDLQSYPKNHLWGLFVNDAARERVRQMTENAFGLHFTIDPTAMKNFRIRMSGRKPASRQEEQGLDSTSRAFHGASTEISNLSDGVQAFVGLTSAVMSQDHRVILIDEPEAFLHPPLARRLGSELAKVAKERKASLVASTHSAQFVLGCIEAVENATIIRLGYEGGVASTRRVDAQDIKKIMKSALLRSTGVIQGLFHRAVIVGESDTDRVFYDEINRRLIDANRGIVDALFLNAQNMHTVGRVVGPLRRAGIPAVAVVDLDFITQTGVNWSGLLDACNIAAGDRPYLDSERTHFNTLFSTLSSAAAGRNLLKNGGISNLSPADQSRFQIFLDKFASYGLYLVPLGEVESWMKSKGATGHGPGWLENIFGAIGEGSDSPNYLQAQAGDVWDFIEKIGGWVNNPSRPGM